jgi:hypothetical protein
MMFLIKHLASPKLFLQEDNSKIAEICLSLPDESKIVKMLELTGPKPFQA